MPDLILAVDPGREKCGLAVVHRDQGLKHKEIINTQKLKTAVQLLVNDYNITHLILGDRTTSKQARQLLSSIITLDGRSVQITLVDEHRSTDQARQRYWQDNPPCGLKRLIPLGLQVPPCPIDDYVALLLAERYFASSS